MSSAGRDVAGDDSIKHRDTMLGAAFPSTQWTMVFKTHRDDAEAARALNELCRRYWYPIYAYLRCRGFERPDAQDITQSFFLSALSSELLQQAKPEKGKLRSFLLGALTRHLGAYRRYQGAQKRGGRAIVLPMECMTSEGRYENELKDHHDPESIFLSTWAKELLERARANLRQHYETTGRKALFDALQGIMEDDDSTEESYRQIAARLRCSETALRLQVYRMRKRFAHLLRKEVTVTVETPEEIEEELAWLGKVLRQR